MTARELKIAKKILNALHELDGGQEHALTLHGEIGATGCCTSAEFDEVLAWLDSRKYVIGVSSEFKGVLWSISDLGESARRKM